MRPLTARDIMHPDLLDENGQLIEKSSLLERTMAESTNLEAIKAAVEKLRNQRFIVPMGRGLPGPPPYTGCMWQSDGRWCSNMATHRGKETCEHEHIFTIFACDEHRDSQSESCSRCILLDGNAHTCRTRLHDVERLPE